MKVIKRNGSEVEHEIKKIKIAISKANKEVKPEHQISDYEIDGLTNVINNKLVMMNRAVHVEEIQDLVELKLMEAGAFEVARKYIRYRHERNLKRIGNSTDAAVLSLVDCKNEEILQENSNKNPRTSSTQRDYVAGEVSKDISKRLLIPEDITKADEDGIVHFHDKDYFLQYMHNCDLVNSEDMLQNGTVISGTLIEKPKKFSTACNVETQFIAQIASSQYGGQSISLAHLAPFVQCTRETLRKKYAKLLKYMPQEAFDEFIEECVYDDIKAGVQTIQYQVVTLMTTNGQAPFITVYMDINEVEDEVTRKDLANIIKEVLLQRIQGVKNEKGVWVSPAFPKLIYTLDENNIHPDSEYYYLTQLAAECTAKRMVPDYISAKVMRELKNGNVYTCMGCRSFLTANYIDPETGKPKFYGRFNQGVVTLNLPDVALSSGGDMDKFWEIFDERLDLCYRALMCRHNRLKGTPSDVAPILWQHGALARLQKGETIDKLLYNGYSTISLGYAGLYECTKYMTGHSHTDDINGGKEFALAVMQHMNDACAAWKAKENIDFSLYGTPLESTTYKFAKSLQKRFGIIEGITDHNYITNSYHVCVREEIDAFTKLKFESEFQPLSPGGAISYVEVPDMKNNLEAVITLMQYIYENIMYAEINTKSDYCHVCGYDGEIQIIEEDSKLIWECPNCKNRDQTKLNVSRRTCGYIGTNFWNQGRTQEIRDRVLHL